MDVIIENIIEHHPDQLTTKIKIEHFSLLSMIGKGSYADVILARKKDTGTIYALKMLKKSKIELKNHKTHVKIERNILIEVQHPFIIHMIYTFQSEKMLYFALEYCPGGELFNLLQKKRQFSEDCARFYIVQILLALEYLHQFDIAYRDLKPENVLIDKDGYIRLTDFGLSKKGIKGNNETNSVCGTPEYLAPEILFQKGHGKAVDWWTLGAILFEMLTGLPPFYTPNREDLFKKIKYFTLRYPDYLSENAKNLLEGLFQKDPEQRLGAGQRDADEIKSHPWFANVDWDAYLRKEIQAPFVPIVANDIDVSNFDPEFTEAPIGSLGDTVPGQTYPDWSYNGSEKSKAVNGMNHEENSYCEARNFAMSGLEREERNNESSGSGENKMVTE